MDGTPSGDFGGFVAAAAGRGSLVVQPRMGFSDPVQMRRGLVATAAARATTVGTITVDSYTRVGDLAAAEAAVAGRAQLNGYPIATHRPTTTRSLLPTTVPVQVRHGSAAPLAIIEGMTRVGLSATEGGPVSYCLPYGRVPLAVATDNWRRACDVLLARAPAGSVPHLETFGGCMLGQLCPPALLVALSVLEAMFFAARGIPSVSVSLTQQTDHQQDLAALGALRVLAERHLPGVQWHVVLYAYMGVFPQTPAGARLLAVRAAELAVLGGAERLIVKTVAEAHRIPTVEENVAALELSHSAAAIIRSTHRPSTQPRALDAVARLRTDITADATALIEATLEGHDEIGAALVSAFARGILDVPFCLHADNAGRARAAIDRDGRLVFTEVGDLPLRRRGTDMPLTSRGLLDALVTVRDRCDQAAS